MQLPTLNYSVVVKLVYTFAAFSSSAFPCGWWGDGEMSRHNYEALSTRSDQTRPKSDSLKASKLPGRLGYGIAILEPGLAIPYLQATRGQAINRIDQLKVFGFKAVIDLGTEKNTAILHKTETEALGMNYISIPIVGEVPNQIQVDDFTQDVINAGDGALLVYAPKSELLGTIWAAHLVNLGAPIDFAISQGKKFGMGKDQESILRNRKADN